MPTTPALSAAKMRRDLGVTTVKLANNSVTLEKIQQLDNSKFLGRTSSGTGNPEQINQFLHMKVPGWTNGGHVTNFALLSSYLDGVARSNQNINTDNMTFEVIPASTYFATNSYDGCILAANGKMYLIPDYRTNCLVFDPSNNSFTTFGTVPSYAPYATFKHGVLAPNGKIYCIPNGSQVFGVIDPSNNTFASFGSMPATVSTHFQGGVLAPNGKIYCFPYASSTFCRVIDPNTNTVSSIGIPSQNFVSPIVSFYDGKIYAFGSVFVELNPNNDSIVTYPSLIGEFYAMAPNGKFYFIQNNSWGYFNPVSKTNTTFSHSLPLGSSGSGSVFLAPDGKIYSVPYSSTIGAVIDPISETIKTYGNNVVFPGVGAFSDGGVLPNGKLFFSPFTSTSVVLGTPNYNNNWNINVLTMPVINQH